jgi:ABC-type multidrug transport system fused ATPase/permease subunit
MKYIKFYRYLIPYWKKEVLVLLLGSLSLCFGLAGPYLSKLMIDGAYAGKDLKLFITLLLTGGIIFVLSSIINEASSYWDRYIKLKINFDLNRDLFRKLQILPYSFFQDTSTGKHLFMINNDIGQAEHFITNTIPSAITLTAKSIFIFIIVLYLNWKMALGALAILPLFYIIPLYFAGRLEKTFKIRLENSESIFGRLQETLSHVQLIKSFGRERHQARSYIKSLIKNLKLSTANEKLERISSLANNFANRLIFGAITFYGGYQIIKGNMTLGSLTAITIYLNQLFGLQGSLSEFFQNLAFSSVCLKRLDAILNLEPQAIETKDAKNIRFSSGSIEFKNVSFAYTQGKNVLDNLTFYISGGSFVGLVGHSGRGKTTLINLILKLYSPLKGEVLIDKDNINGIKSESFYKQISVALQNSFLWNTSIMDNILFGYDYADRQEVIQAAKLAEAHNFIMEFPNRYETVIGEMACKISEGQKERIAIARALIKRTKILILDEAMSSLDSETEDRIIDNIRHELKDSTVLIVSHRISTIKKMDLVYFLENGSTIHIGTHDDLQERKQSYRDLFSSQIEKTLENNFITQIR